MFDSVSANTAEATSGGWIDVDGWHIKVPDHLQVALPATFVGFKDFVTSASRFSGFEVEVRLPLFHLFTAASRRH
jgi:hypothetical protein